ncbi:biotin transporter BioY [Kineococcus indalonis]|uniref:biotin transporter BioY n=1 Tax=Kineococcus indalonis TaxID=2696566 RepID=UPI00141254F4|nr:biotin transporter BioY [Kineococcus indalonis]NAZ86244.1 biotin transporter BioY [Kineococcus indalonis]
MSATASVPSRPGVLLDPAATSRTRTALLVAGGVALTAVLAQVSVPVPGTPVPVSGQTLAVVLTAACLGPVRGAAVQVAYLLSALAGLPVYADGEGGPAAVFGPTGGYVVGFVPAAVLISLAARRGVDRGVGRALLLFAAGQGVVFAVGVPWLALSAGLSASGALRAGFVPFVPGGLLKAALGAVLVAGAWRLLGRRAGAVGGARPAR